VGTKTSKKKKTEEGSSETSMFKTTKREGMGRSYDAGTPRRVQKRKTMRAIRRKANPKKSKRRRIKERDRRTLGSEREKDQDRGPIAVEI